MEDKIYQILKKHKLPLKKREELVVDLLRLFNENQSEELKLIYHNHIETSTPSTECNCTYMTFGEHARHCPQYKRLITF